MRIRSAVLASSAAVALVATGASAQSTAGQGPGGTPSSTTTAPTDTPADAGDIVVTGIRASLGSAERIKRDAPQIIDSVVAEDIGKLPDISVADTAARIAGVQVYRTAGEASSVLVRGLPYFETTYDGREIFTAETRTVALQDFPSQNVAALQVIKTSTADLVESGLAGSVNVVSRKPFDLKDSWTVSASAQANYSRNADRFRPQGNLLISHRWDSNIGEMGLLVNGSYTELRYLDNELSNTDFVANPTVNGQVVRLPDIQRLYDRSGDRTRPSVNAAFQWKPNLNLEIYAGALWQGFRNRIDDRLVEADLYNATSYSNLTFRPGTNIVTGGTIVDGNQPFTFQGATYNKTDTFQYSGGFKYDEGRWHLSADGARTISTFLGSTESLDRRFTGTPTITFNNTTPQFNITGLNQNSASGFLYQGLFEENQRSAGRGWQVRSDLTYDVDNSFLHNIQIGARYTDRVADRFYGNRYAYQLPLGINASTLPLASSVFTPGFAGTDVQGFRNFSSPLYQSFRDNVVAMRQFVIANCPAILVTDPNNGCKTYTTTPVADPLLYHASEQTIAGYAQANYAFGDVVDGTVGVRIVNTRERVQGPQPAAIAAFNSSNEFTDYLPNVSARIHLTPQAQFRLSYTQTRTLPNFSDLNPNLTLAAPPSTPDQKGTPSNPQTGSGGNPFLKPYTSNNFDASLEYYVSRTAFLSLAYFHRDLDGFFANALTIIPNDPVHGYTQITTPFNTGKGHIDGWEIQGQTFLDIAGLPQWAKGFGLQASVTFLNGKEQVGGVYQRIIDQVSGVSNFLYSVVGLYEQGPLSARVTLQGRSSFLATIQPRGDDNYFEYGKPAPRLDLSVNYNILPSTTIFADWTNVTGAPFKQYESSARAGADRAEFVRFIRYDESVVSAGVRIRLGR